MNEPAHRTWSLTDLARLEYLRLLDRGQDLSSLTQRDRQFYQQLRQPEWGREQVLLAWVSWRQQQECDHAQPGSPMDAGLWLNRALTLLLFFLLSASVVSGMGLTTAALYYDGTVPINVSWYLGVIVVPQLLLLALMLLLGLLAMIGPGFLSSFYQWPARLLQQGLTWLIALLSSHSKSPGGGQAELHSQHLAQMVSLIGERYRRVLSLRLLSLVQWGGVAFNLAVLLTTVLLLAVTDRAFGWQSALFTDATQVHRWLTGLALPWHSWLDADWTLPSLSAVADSRIILREGGGNNASALLAWWPFLMLCVLFYGLLPRLLAAVVLSWREQQAISAIDWNTADMQAIWMRMRSVELSAGGLPSEARSEYAAADAMPSVMSADSWQGQTLVLEDSLQRYPQSLLKQHMPSNAELLAVKRFVGEHLPTLSTASPLAVVLEGWQAPIQEQLSDIAALAAQVQELHLILLGKPSGDSLQALSTARLEVWRQKLALLSASNLIIHTLGAAEPA